MDIEIEAPSLPAAALLLGMAVPDRAKNRVRELLAADPFTGDGDDGSTAWEWGVRGLRLSFHEDADGKGGAYFNDGE